MFRLTFIFLILPATSFAACTQEAIQFYLDKGFNQEQITKLCSSSGDSTPSYQPYQKPVVIVQEGYATGVNAEERKAISALRGGIDGRSVDITTNGINYIRKVCIKWKLEPTVENWLDKCIDVAFSVSRDDLKVNASRAKLLMLGQQQLEVSSNSIKRKFVTADPWADVDVDKRILLERKFETFEVGNTTIIPLRNTADPSQMVNAIRTLADVTKAQSSGESSSEVARVLDDNYVPPTEEEYLASQPTYKEVQEEKKKKKKWWNPFD
ncbi:MAG: hypothetical protein R8G33_10050 [Gammaproteobacteria bacterium]|nr:hypothetical protein [Gammaproteobacteria bacterium]